MNKLIIKYSDKIITISEKTNQRYLSSNKSCIIENGIITKRYSYNEEIRKNIRKILHIDRDDIVLGHVGRFVPEKNQKFLLKVLVKLLEVNSRYKLLLIGDGDTYKNELIKMIND
ncbi:TPA: glycosyltransferase, partial [Streptococcus suis]